MSHEPTNDEQATLGEQSQTTETSTETSTDQADPSAPQTQTDDAMVEWLEQQPHQWRFRLFAGLLGLASLWVAAIPLYLWSVAWDNQLHIMIQTPHVARPGARWPLKAKILGSKRDFEASWSKTETGPAIGQKTHIKQPQPQGQIGSHWLRVPSIQGKRLWLQLTERSGWWRRSRRFLVPLQAIKPQNLILATLSKPMYQPGDTVHLRLQARSKETGLAVGNLQGMVRLFEPQTKSRHVEPEPLHYPIQLSAYGVGQARFVLPVDATLGTYRLEIEFGARRVKGSFVVSRYTLPAFRVQLTPSPWKRAKDPLQLKLQARYAYGAPVVRGKVVVQLEGTGVKKRFRGSTNKQGQVQFTWRSRKPPAQLVATVQVTDTAGRVESTQRIIQSPRPPARKVKKREYDFALLGVESGVVVPGIKSTLSFSTDIPGKVRGALVCQGRSSSLHCDTGLCRATMRLDARPLPTSCRLKLGAQDARSIPLLRWLYHFSRGKQPPRIWQKQPKPQQQEQHRQQALFWRSLSQWQGRIRLKQRVFRAGDTIKGQLLWREKGTRNAPPKTPHGILLIHRRQRSDGYDSVDKILDRSPLKAGPDRTFAVKLPLALQGIMWLRAEGLRSHHVAPARIVVQPRYTATIKGTTDKPLYRPGQQVKLTLQARRDDGKGVAATLGVEAVDARILALRGAQDTFLQWALPFLSQLQPYSDIGSQRLKPHRAALHQWLLGDQSIPAARATTYMAATLAASARLPTMLAPQMLSDDGRSSHHKWHHLPTRQAQLAGFDRRALIELWWGAPLFISLLTLWIWVGVVVIRWTHHRTSGKQWEQQRERIEGKNPSSTNQEEHDKATQDLAFATPSQREVNGPFALILCASLLLHGALYYVTQQLGPLKQAPQIRELEPRFARLIISPAGLQLYRGRIHSLEQPKEKAARPKPKRKRQQPAKKAPKKAPKARLALRRYISQKGLLAVIGTPTSSEQLRSLMSRSALQPQDNADSPSPAVARWSTSRAMSRKRPLSQGSWSAAPRYRKSRTLGTVGLSKKMSTKRSILALLGAGARSKAGALVTAKGFGSDGTNALGLKSAWLKGKGQDNALRKINGARITDNSPRPLKPPRQSFPEILFWKPEWQLPSSGKGVLRFRVADAITSWHLRLFGLTAQGFPLRYTKKIRVFQPFFLEWQPPKQMVEGDAITTSLIITNHTRKQLAVSVGIRATKPGRMEIKLNRQRVVIAPRSFGVVKLRLQAKAPGSTDLVLSATAGKEQDALTRQIKVLPQGEPIKATWSGLLRGAHQQALALPAAARLETATLQVRLLRPVGVMLQSTSALLRRPYGCFEQTTSSTAPNVLVYQLLKAQGKESTSQARQARQYIGQGYKRMLTFERDTGGFSLYGKGRPSLHLTAYGYRVLLEMRRVYPVSQELLLRTRRWLLQQQRPDGSFAQRAWFPLAELRQTILAMKALKGAEDTGPLRRARAWLSQQLPKVEDPYIIAMALTVVKASDRPGLFKRLLETVARESSRRSQQTYQRLTLFGSWGKSRQLAIKALALQAMPGMALTMEHQQLAKRWLKELVKARIYGGGWATTELTLAVLRAINAQINPSYRAFRPVSLRFVGGDRAKTFALVRPGVLDLTSLLKANVKRGYRKMKLALRSPDTKSSLLMYQIDLAYHPKRPTPPAKGALGLTVSPSRKDLRVGEALRYRVALTNQRDRRIAAPMIVLGVPPGLVPQDRSAQSSLTKRIVRNQELRGGKLYLYLRGLPARAKRRFKVGFVGRFPARGQSGLHQAFPYYNPAQRTTLQSFQVTVR